MYNLLNLAPYLLVVNWICVTAVNHQAGNEFDNSNLKNSHSGHPSQDRTIDSIKGRNGDSPYWSSRFQKNAGLLGVPQPPSGIDQGQGEASKSSDASASHNKASSSDQKPPDGEAAKEKQASFTDILFTTDVDKAKLKDNYEVPMGIKLKEDCADGVTFSFKDTRTKDMAEHFEAKCDAANKKQIQMKLVKNFADNVLSKLGSITLILQAEDKDNKKLLAETVVWMKLFTKPSKEEKLTFEKPKYEIQSLFEYVGVVQQFKAKMVNDLSAIIKYSIISIDSVIKDSVTIDAYTGVLQVKKSLKPGQYQIKLQAQTADEKYKDTADVTLTIKYMTVCNSKDLSFVHSLLVVKIPQGTTVQEVVKLDKQQDGCVYSWLSQKPVEGYFDLNEKTGSLSLKKEVFRSDQIFGTKRSEPKMVLELEIRCDTKKPTTDRKRRAAKPENKGQKKSEETQIEDPFSVLNNPKKLIIEVLIDDGGPLVFPQPEVFVGYPQSYDFIEEALPPLLTTVQVDRKNLKNDADIRYEIEEANCPFTINPTSGKIYPRTYHKGSDKLTFTVIAKRMDKDKVITEAKTKVTVFFLTLKQIVQIDLTEVDMSNIDSPLQHLQVQSDFILEELSHAVLPLWPVTDAAKNNAEPVKHLIRVYGYGFDSKQQAIVDGDVISDKLKSSPNVVDIEVIQAESSNVPGKSGRRFWPSGLLICVVVIILIFGVFGSYLIYARHRPVPFGLMRSRHHDHTSTTPLEDDMEGPSRTRWINSATTNPFSKFNNTHSNCRPPYSDFRTRNVAFSFHSADATLDSTNNYSDLPHAQLGTLSSFKPETRDERDTPLNVINLQSEPTYGTLTPPEPPVNPNSEVPNNGVPVLPVIMLPPVNIDRNRRNRRVSAETRGENSNGAGMSPKNQ